MGLSEPLLHASHGFADLAIHIAVGQEDFRVLELCANC